VAGQPLRVEELAEFLASDFKAGPIPQFHMGWRLDGPVDRDVVPSTCSTSLAVVNVEVFQVIQFSHFSVEFLISAPLAEHCDINDTRSY
jgi:hypothetical protein